MASVTPTSRTISIAPLVVEGTKNPFHNVSEISSVVRTPLAFSAQVTGTEKLLHTETVDPDQEIIDKFPEYEDYRNELSQTLGRRATTLDMLQLIYEMIKLGIRDVEQSKISRLQEIAKFIEESERSAQAMTKNAKDARNANIGGGIMSIVAAVIPIVGHVGGAPIMSFLKNTGIGFLKKFGEMPQDKCFKAIAGMMQSGADMQKGMGHVHNSFSESERIRRDCYARCAEREIEKLTQSLSSRGQEQRDKREYAERALNMVHEAAVSLVR